MRLPAVDYLKTKWKAKISRKVMVVMAFLTILVMPSLVVYMTTSESQQVLPATSMGNMYLAPEAPQAKQGDPLAVNVRIEPGTPIDTVVARLQFNPDQLTYTSVSYQNSPFATQIPIVVTSNRVTVESAKFGNGPVTADSLIAQVTFTAKQTGVAELTLSGDAAYAGVATHPTIMGEVVPITTSNSTPASAGQPVTGVARQTETASRTTASAPVQLTKSLLTSIGLSEYKAAAVAPVLAICLGVCVASGFGYALYRFLARRRRVLGLDKNKPIIHKQGDNHVE
ncbi:hypothetical protein IPL85_02580 [Candidatus Saccharibacteria bacterium]|nr:MAG: hypothetical protein IPL85_02580 [Candidatus Saccharibacteria bacterium]